MNRHLLKLIDEVDRNGSTAEHWAAGGGHVTRAWNISHDISLQIFLSRYYSTTGDNIAKIMTTEDHRPKKKVRRMDGKTTLHYAARYGRNNAWGCTAAHWTVSLTLSTLSCIHQKMVLHCLQIVDTALSICRYQLVLYEI
mmetsp:Transcript_17491/g.27250  ORF Transcript_17491/g.27250 Transcript_17491/m.27250 type:complete len:140 (-) Transcript_17491:16-435(-)